MQIDNIKWQELLEKAKATSKQAYAPYSGYKVGAAILSSSGKIYCGCNVENASFSLTICAERNALFQAISEGERSFNALAIYVDSDKSFPPCGACRQVLAEFAPKLPILIANRKTSKETSLDLLLPDRFTLSDA
ncbi:MAG TPA: cytidine deaminase [Candidatus Cloacimonadota bacterium]|nr:cytidine deaminase [Candidatus Cloacimonadota bacterium]HQL14197.1 cytidine deaminase [Candidatus Cloacimonadota bacterium]